MKSPFVVLSRLKLLLGIVLCLTVFVFPVYGAEFVVFQSELVSSPLPASSLADLEEDLALLKKEVQAELKINVGLDAFLDNRIDEMTTSLKELQKQPMNTEEKQHAEALETLLVYYKNYKTTVKAVIAGEPHSSAPSSSPPYNVAVYDALRFSVHKTFMDAKGGYILALQLNTICGKGLKDLKESRERLTLSVSEQGKLSVELQEIDFASDVLGFQVCVDELRRDLATLALRKEELSKVRKGIQFNHAELEGIMKKLSVQEADQQRQERLLYAQHQKAESAYLKERDSFKDMDNKEIVPQSDNSVMHSRLALSYVEYVCYETWYKMQTTALDELQGEKELWQARFDLYNGKINGDQIWQAREKIGKLIEEGNASREHREFLLRSNFSMALQNLKNKREQSNGEIRGNLDEAIAAIEKVLSEFSRNYSIGEQQHLLMLYSFQEELDARLSTFKYARQAEEFGLKMMSSIWNAVLWDGDGYAITVRKLTGAFCILLVGLFVSLWFSRFFERRMLALSKKNETSIVLLRYVVFYSLLCVFIVVALKTARIPLTAFAFVGGAIGVGLGFGMQDIFSNLVSGIIIMGNRPFKLGDIVETGAYTGTISEISSRATIMQCFDGTEVVIPNGHFLENSFINWTRKNPQKRLVVTIATSLDADPDEVERLILAIVKENNKICKDPVPLISMENFNYIGYEFNLYFWLDIVRHNSADVSGHLRSQIVYALKARNWLCRWTCPGECGE